MRVVVQFFAFLISLVACVYTFYVVGKFVFFLSEPRSISRVYTWVFNLLDNKSRLETAYGAIVFDTLYAIGFIVQHSLMKSDIVKKIWHTLGLAAAERAIYSLTSSLCLHYLLDHWASAASIVLWQVDVASSRALWWLFVLIHAFAWIVICGGSILMDLPEIVGIKQAYYALKGQTQPLSYKSADLQHLYGHVRHPSFVGLSVVLWVTNLMTIDRLILSVLFTIYMYIAWSTDRRDYIYQKFQLKRKLRELRSK